MSKDDKLLNLKDGRVLYNDLRDRIEDRATTEDVEAALDGKADKNNTVLETSLSRGRKEGTTIGTGSFAFGSNVEASGNYSHAEGAYTAAKGNSAHAEGTNSQATGHFSHAEGGTCIASGNYSHAEGCNSTSSATYAHAEGYYSEASGTSTHSEGNETKAIGAYSHAEGNKTQAIGGGSHAEGQRTYASGALSHAEGEVNFNASRSSHVEGAGNELHSTQNYTSVNGTYSISPVTSGDSISVQPKDASGASTGNASSRTRGIYANIVGNGTADNARSNAFALTWTGDGKYAGDVYVGCNADSSGGTKLPTVDDTAGAGDTDKVWSADKSAGVRSDLLSAISALGLSVVDGKLCVTYEEVTA